MRTGGSAQNRTLVQVLCVSIRFAGKYRDTLGSRKDSFTNSELNCSESECDSSSRRLSFMKMVGLGKQKKESTTDRLSQGTEEQLVVEEVKPREPLSGKETRRTLDVDCRKLLYSPRGRPPVSDLL